MKISSRVPLVLLMPIVLILALGLEVACIKKTTGTVTPAEKVASYNAALADINQTVEQGAELAASGNLIAKDVAAKVIDYTGRVASIHLQVTAIVAKGANASPSDMVNLQALLSQISDSGQILVASGALSIKNPKSQQTIAADIQGIISLAQTIINLIPSLSPAPPVTAMAYVNAGGALWTL